MKGYTSEKSFWSKSYKITPRLNPVEDLKKTTKHTSTAGKKLIISSDVLLNKKPTSK